MWRKRSEHPQFPDELLDEARRYPGGWVYEIDGAFERDGAVPPHAIRRGWEIGPDGRPTGSFTDNPNYGVRQPLASVEQLKADATAQSTGTEIELLVRRELTQNGAPIDFDIGIAAVTDFVVGLGFEPALATPVADRPDGLGYRFTRLR